MTKSVCETADVSYLQERVWHRARVDPAAVNYNLPGAFRLRGRLHVNALERAFNAVICRHEALRTVFREVDGRVRQVILSERVTPLVEYSPPADDVECFVRERLAAEANEPFSLENGPLLRLGLIKIARDHHVLLLTAHHIVSDGWSANVLWGEVAALYDAFIGGRQPVLPEPYPFRAYAFQQQEWLRSEARERQLNYWCERLRGADPVLQLPAPRGTGDPARSATRYFFTLPDEIGEAVLRVSHGYRVTPFMLLLMAFKVLLHRQTGREDISVAFWVAGRRRVEWERMIGLVRNAVILRTTVCASDTFASVLQRLRNCAFAAYENQEIPCEQVYSTVAGSAMAVWRERQVWFSSGRRRRLELAGLDVTAMRTAPRYAGRYLSVAVDHVIRGGPPHWEGDVEFNPNLIDSGTVELMVVQFQRVLQHLCANPTLTVGALGATVPLLTSDNLL